MKNQFLSILLVLCMLLTLLPGTAWAAEASGTCGDNLTWSYSDGILTIQGTGSMANYSSFYGSLQPWLGYCEQIRTVSISDGVSNIGNHAFFGCSSLTSVTIPDSVTSIGNSAFGACLSLTSMIIPNSVTNIGGEAFWRCSSLTSVTIPDNVTNIGSFAFSACSGLISVTIPDNVINIEEHAFYGCSSLTDVYYSGSETDWRAISIGSDNDYLTNATIHYNSIGPDTTDLYGTDLHILIYASKPLLANKVGDAIDFCCGIYTKDGQVIGWTNPSIVTDNPDLVYISGYFEEDSLAYFQVKGLAESTCTLTITDSATGIYGKIDLTFGSGVTSTKSYRIDQVPDFEVDESTWLFGEAKTQTNFYDVNGLYVNKFDSKYNKTTGKYDVSFTVYNSRYYNGAVDVFDAYGKWIETYEIGKVTSSSSIRDTIGDGWDLVTDLVVEKKGLSYTLSSSTQETPIKFSVPKGGYFTISNNYMESPGVFMFNVLEYIALSANTTFDLGLKLIGGESLDKSVLKSFKESVVDGIFESKSLDSEFLSDQFIGAMKSYARKAVGTSTRFGIGEAASVMTCSFEELLKSFDIDLETIAKTELGIAESAFRRLTGPISVGFDVVFSISEYGDLITQTTELLNSGNKPYIIIYATEDAYTSSTVNGVTVDDRAGSIDKEAVLQVFKLEYEEAIPMVGEKEIPTGQYELYSICFLKNGEESSINGTVTVMIPIPDSYKKESCVILRQEEDGSWTELEYTIQDNFLVFETTHFSLYAIVDVSEVASAVHFTNDTLNMRISTSQKLVFNVEPMSASIASLVWESSNPIIANVDSSGTVSAFSPGTVTISATTASGNTANVIVTVSPASNSFIDIVSGTYYYEAVLWAVEHGITQGTTATTFSPDAPCTRAQIVSFLWRAAGSPKMNGANLFTDVSAADYYYDAVLWAVENGVTAGTTSTIFSPNAPCTRAQAVSFLYRAKNSSSVGGSNSFVDLVSGAYYMDAVQWAVNTRVTAGTSDTTFSPDQTCTRAQIVSFLYRGRAK